MEDFIWLIKFILKQYLFGKTESVNKTHDCQVQSKSIEGFIDDRPYLQFPAVFTPEHFLTHVSAGFSRRRTIFFCRGEVRSTGR